MSARFVRARVFLLLTVLAFVFTGCLWPSVSEVNGTVTYEGGLPIENATVRIGSQSARTDASGGFSIKNVRPGTHLLTVLLDGEVVYSTQVTVRRQPTTVSIVLPVPDEKAHVHGFVEFEDSTPASGASITLAGRTVNVESDGSFSLEDIPFGKHGVVVTLDGEIVYADEITVLQDDVFLSIVITSETETGELRGVIQAEDGSPLSNVTVSLGGIETQTDSNGEYSFENLTFGTYILSVIVDGEPVHSETVVVNNDVIYVDVIVRLTATVVGWVECCDINAPVVGARVVLGEWEALTDEEGKYTFTEIPFGQYDIFVYVGSEPVVGPLSVAVSQRSVEVDGILIPWLVAPNFSKVEEGSLPDGWIRSVGVPGVYEEPNSGRKALRLLPGSESSQAVYVRFPAVLDRVIVEFEALTPSTTHRTLSVAATHQPDPTTPVSTYGPYITANANAQLSYYANNAWTHVAEFDPSAWNWYKLDIDVASQTYAIYLNDMDTPVAYAPFREKYFEINRVEFMNTHGNSDVAMWIDNVRIYIPAENWPGE